MKKQKRRGKICLVLLYPKVIQRLFQEVKELGESTSDESSSSNSSNAR